MDVGEGFVRGQQAANDFFLGKFVMQVGDGHTSIPFARSSSKVPQVCAVARRADDVWTGRSSSQRLPFNQVEGCGMKRPASFCQSGCWRCQSRAVSIAVTVSVEGLRRCQILRASALPVFLG